MFFNFENEERNGLSPDSGWRGLETFAMKQSEKSRKSKIF